VHTPDNLLSQIKPINPKPSLRQIAWHKMETYAFIHFTVTTFIDKEWGYGNESPEIFNPTAFDANQIVSTVKKSGLKGLIFTCKHHDGFCLWPSKYTEHSVKNSPWRDGKGDMVLEISKACRAQNIKFGIYLSPWDRHQANYGYTEYLEYYKNQLKELLENYGPIFEIWFDGANGGDGYYGGACETRKISDDYYDWDNILKIIREMQPNSCVFGDIGFDIRWVGNEDGIAGYPCWATVYHENKKNLEYTAEDAFKLRNNGYINGNLWQGAECDVSIRPGWFFHESENEQVKSAETLLDIYFQSVGHGASLLLNLPPDKHGLIHEKDIETLMNYKELYNNIFNYNLSRINHPKHYCLIENSCKHITELEPADNKLPIKFVQEFIEPVEFNIIRLCEDIAYGQRINKFSLCYWSDNQWFEFIHGSSIGNKVLIRTDNIKANKVCLNIKESKDFPVINDFSIFIK
jgi:alpha-L-fucosidase